MAQKSVGWWRRRDSNPRYGFRPYNGLANRRLQPLGHVSVPNKGRHSCPSLVPCSSRPDVLILLFDRNIIARLLTPPTLILQSAGLARSLMLPGAQEATPTPDRCFEAADAMKA